jgi:hypothetical protein
MPAQKRTKQRGGALEIKSGAITMDDNTTAVAMCLIGAAVVGASLYFYKGQLATPALLKPTVVVVESKASVPAPATYIPMDPRFAPLSPEKSYAVPPDLRGQPPISAGVGAFPINVQTQGLPDSYQQVGVLTAPGGTETSGSPTRTILPLFGRRVLYNRDKWNYYTRTDGMNPVQVPVQFKRRNCDDDNGCDEVLDGDSVGCPVLGQSYTANIYRYSTPRYLPSMPSFF